MCSSDTDWWATIRSDRSGASVAAGMESIADTSSGRSGPPRPARSVASSEQVGTLRQRRQRPREVEREVVLVGRVLDVGPLDHRVLEAEQHARVDLEREVQVDGSLAPLLGVEVDLPVLAQRVALHEVPLVVDVEPVLDRVVLEIGHEPGDVDDRHYCSALSAPRRPLSPSARVRNARPRCETRCFSAADISANVRPSPSSGTKTGS